MQFFKFGFGLLAIFVGVVSTAPVPNAQSCEAVVNDIISSIAVEGRDAPCSLGAGA